MGRYSSEAARFMMKRPPLPYSPAFPSQRIKLARPGRNPDDQAKEFEPPGPSIRNLQQADIDDGCRYDGLAPQEWKEIQSLSREDKGLR